MFGKQQIIYFYNQSFRKIPNITLERLQSCRYFKARIVFCRQLQFVFLRSILCFISTKLFWMVIFRKLHNFSDCHECTYVTMVVIAHGWF